jgi:hypothetical protein
MEWIDNLTLHALRSHVRDDLALLLVYAPEAAPEVRRMVEQERICGPFLTFDLDQSLETVRVRIIAPEAARDSADMLFGQFLVGVSREGQ